MSFPCTSLNDIVDTFGKNSSNNGEILPPFLSYLIIIEKQRNKITADNNINNNSTANFPSGLITKRRFRDIAAKVILALRPLIKLKKSIDVLDTEGNSSGSAFSSGFVFTQEEIDTIREEITISPNNGPVRFFSFLNRIFFSQQEEDAMNANTNNNHRNNNSNLYALAHQLLQFLNIWMNNRSTCAGVICSRGFDVMFNILIRCCCCCHHENTDLFVTMAQICSKYITVSIEQYEMTLSNSHAKQLVAMLYDESSTGRTSNNNNNNHNSSSDQQMSLLLPGNSSFLNVSEVVTTNTCDDNCASNNHTKTSNFLFILPVLTSWLSTSPTQALSTIMKQDQQNSSDEQSLLSNFFSTVMNRCVTSSSNNNNNTDDVWKFTSVAIKTIANDDFFDDDINNEDDDESNNKRFKIIQKHWNKICMNHRFYECSSSSTLEDCFCTIAEIMMLSSSRGDDDKNQPLCCIINFGFITGLVNYLLQSNNKNQQQQEEEDNKIISDRFIDMVSSVLQDSSNDDESSSDESIALCLNSLETVFGSSSSSTFFSLPEFHQLLICQCTSKFFKMISSSSSCSSVTLDLQPLQLAQCKTFDQFTNQLLETEERKDEEEAFRSKQEQDYSSTRLLIISLIDCISLGASSSISLTSNNNNDNDANEDDGATTMTKLILAKSLTSLLSFIRNFSSSSSDANITFSNSIGTALEQVNFILQAVMMLLKKSPASTSITLRDLVLFDNTSSLSNNNDNNNNDELVSLLISTVSAAFDQEKMIINVRNSNNTNNSVISVTSDELLSLLLDQLPGVFTSDVLLDEAVRILRVQKLETVMQNSETENTNATSVENLDAKMSLFLEKSLLCEPQGCELKRDLNNLLSIMSTASQFPNALAKSFHLCDKILRRMLGSSHHYQNKQRQQQIVLFVELLRQQFKRTFALSNSVLNTVLSSSSSSSSSADHDDSSLSSSSLLDDYSDELLPLISNILAETQQQGFFPDLVSAFGSLIVSTESKDQACLRSLIQKRKLMYGDLASLIEFLKFRNEDEAAEILMKYYSDEQKNGDAADQENQREKISRMMTTASTSTTSAENADSSKQQRSIETAKDRASRDETAFIKLDLFYSKDSFAISEQESQERMNIFVEALRDKHEKFIEESKKKNDHEEEQQVQSSSRGHIGLVRKLRDNREEEEEEEEEEEKDQHDEKDDETPEEEEDKGEELSPIRKQEQREEENSSATAIDEENTPITRPGTASNEHNATSQRQNQPQQQNAKSAHHSPSSTDSEDLLDNNNDSSTINDEYSLLRHETIQEQRRKLRHDRHKLRKERKQHQEAVKAIDVHITKLFTTIQDHTAESYHSKNYGNRARLVEEEQRLLASQRSKTKDTEIRTLRSLLQKRTAMLMELDHGLELQSSLQQPMKSLVVAVSEKCEKLEYEIDTLRRRLRHQEENSSTLRHKTDEVRLQENDEMQRKIVRLQKELDSERLKNIKNNNNSSSSSHTHHQNQTTTRPASASPTARLSARNLESHTQKMTMKTGGNNNFEEL